MHKRIEQILLKRLTQIIQVWRTKFDRVDHADTRRDHTREASNKRMADERAKDKKGPAAEGLRRQVAATPVPLGSRGRSTCSTVSGLTGDLATISHGDQESSLDVRYLRDAEEHRDEGDACIDSQGQEQPRDGGRSEVLVLQILNTYLASMHIDVLFSKNSGQRRQIMKQTMHFAKHN